LIFGCNWNWVLPPACQSGLLSGLLLQSNRKEIGCNWRMILSDLMPMVGVRSMPL
jgi:hypothetical protein